MAFVETVRRKTRLCWAASTRTKTTKVPRRSSKNREPEMTATSDAAAAAAAAAAIPMSDFVELTSVALADALPLGLLVVGGQAARDIAGPAVVISEALAFVFAGLVGFSWLELSSKSWRHFQRGCYEYVYRTGSEASAFLIGWLLVLRHCACAALASRAIGENFDLMLDNYRLSNFSSMLQIGGTAEGGLFDGRLNLIGPLLCLISTFLCAAHLDAVLRRGCCTVAVNCLLLSSTIFMCVVALYHLDFSNWSDVDKFFPHKTKGVLTGTATTYFLFGISDAAVRWRDGSARSKRRDLATSSLTSNAVTVLAMTSVTSIMTLLVRHGSTGNWSTDPPLAGSFGSAGVVWMRYFVGAVTMVLVFPSACNQLERTVGIIVELSHDGLLPKAFRRSAAGLGLAAAAPTPSASTYAAAGAVTSLGALVLGMTSAAQVASATTLGVHLIGVCHVIADRFKPTDDARKWTKRRRRERGREGGKKNTRGRADGLYGTTPVNGDPCSADPTPSGLGGSDNTPETNDYQNGPTRIGGATPVEDVGRSDPWTAEDGAADISVDISSSSTSSSSDTDIDEIVDEYRQSADRAVTDSNSGDADLLDIRSTSISSYTRSIRLIRAYVVSCLIFAAFACHLPDDNAGHNPAIVCSVVVVVVCVLCSVVCLTCCVRLLRIPRNEPGMRLFFTRCSDSIRLTVALAVVFVVCCLVNSFRPFVCALLLVWICVGFLLYFVYGMHHSHSSSAVLPALMALPEEERGLIDRSVERGRQQQQQKFVDVDSPSQL